MNNTLKWTNAIRQEDGDNMSIGSLRTLSMIDAEHNALKLLSDKQKRALDLIKKHFPADILCDQMGEDYSLIEDLN